MTVKKKVLVFASTFPRWQGDTIVPFVYELSKRLADELDISVLTPNYPGAKADEIMDGMNIHRFRYFLRKHEKLAGSAGILPMLKKNKWYYLIVPFFMVSGFFALIKQIKKNRPDIIHAHWIIPQGLIAALVKKLYGVPFLVTSHGGDIFALQGKLSLKIRRATLKNADKITVVSSAIKREILTKIVSNSTIEVVSMGVDSDRFNPNKKDNSIKEKYGIEGPFLLFVGRLVEKKGVRYLIESMPEIVKEFPKTKLLIIGKGTLEKELKDLNKKLGLGGNVFFTGEIANFELPKYYATADIFIGPSIIAEGGDREGLPVTFMEAMSCGAIIVTTDLEGNKDLILNNHSGFIISQRSTKHISDKVLELLKNRSLMSRIRNQARERIIRQFDWQTISDRYTEILRNMIV